MATITTIKSLEGILLNNNPFPKTRYGSNEQVVDQEGRLEYQVEVLVSDEIGTDQIRVAVKAKSNPVEGIRPQTMVRFNDVCLQMGQFNRKQWSKLAADSVEVVNGAKS